MPHGYPYQEIPFWFESQEQNCDRAIASVFDEIDIAYVSKKIAQTIGDLEAAIEIGIAIAILVIGLKLCDSALS